MSESIRAIVALGNPGADHARDRHNAGFWLADALARRWRLSFSPEKRFKGEAARYGACEETVWLLKPLTVADALPPAPRRRRAAAASARNPAKEEHGSRDFGRGSVR